MATYLIKSINHIRKGQNLLPATLISIYERERHFQLRDQGNDHFLKITLQPSKIKLRSMKVTEKKDVFYLVC